MKQKGVSLITLIIAITIMIILIGVTLYSNGQAYIDKSNYLKFASDIKNVHQAIIVYKNSNNGTIPGNIKPVLAEIPFVMQHEMSFYYSDLRSGDFKSSDISIMQSKVLANLVYVNIDSINVSIGATKSETPSGMPLSKNNRFIYDTNWGIVYDRQGLEFESYYYYHLYSSSDIFYKKGIISDYDIIPTSPKQDE